MKLALINMPFANIYFPSFALSQIKSAIDLKMGTRVETDIIYINHEFALFLGIPLYNDFDVVSQTVETGLEIKHNTNSICDLYFRNLAFPKVKDDFIDLITKSTVNDKIITRQKILEKRERLPEFFEYMINKYQLCEYDMIGFTSMFEQQMSSIALGNMIKKKNGNVKLILGGPNCEYPSSLILSEELEYFDYIVSGYGVAALLLLLQCCLDDKVDDLWKINGLYSKDINRIRNKVKADQEQYRYGDAYDLDEVLLIDYNAFFQSYFSIFDLQHKPVVFFETSRGCWWAEQSGCTFCAVNGNEKKYVCMSSEKAIEYLNLLFQSNKGRANFFWSTDSTMPLHYLDEVFPYIQKDVNQRVFYEVRADMDETAIAKLRDNDIIYVQVGIEALSSQILKLINKGTTAFTNIIFLKLCCEYEINVLWNLLSGIPGENEQTYVDYLKLFPLLKHLSPPSGIWSISYQKNSLLSESCKDRLNPLTLLLAQLYPFSERSIKDMAYYYELTDKKLIYSKKKIKLIYEISILINQWKSVWIDPSCKNPPRLYIEKDKINKELYCIVDSRFENEVSYTLTSGEAQFLKFLDIPRTLDEIKSSEFKNGLDMLDKFQSLKLLFEEGTTYLNLTCNKRNSHFKPILPETLNDILGNDDVS